MDRISPKKRVIINSLVIGFIVKGRLFWLLLNCKIIFEWEVVLGVVVVVVVVVLTHHHYQ